MTAIAGATEAATLGIFLGRAFPQASADDVLIAVQRIRAAARLHRRAVSAGANGEDEALRERVRRHLAEATLAAQDALIACGGVLSYLPGSPHVMTAEEPTAGLSMTWLIAGEDAGCKLHAFEMRGLQAHATLIKVRG
jgi:hypothetical protein